MRSLYAPVVHTCSLEPDVDYKINLQDGKHMWERGDYACERLFTYVDPCVFERRTYKLFFDLLDNYERGVRHTLALYRIQRNGLVHSD